MLLMGVFFAFIVGWAMGSRGGEQRYEEVVSAFKEVRDSDEFATLVGALRTHSGYLLRQAADWLQDTEAQVSQSTDFVERVRNMVQPRTADDDG
jgi:hypothetical protein